MPQHAEVLDNKTHGTAKYDYFAWHEWVAYNVKNSGWKIISITPVEQVTSNGTIKTTKALVVYEV